MGPTWAKVPVSDPYWSNLSTMPRFCPYGNHLNMLAGIAEALMKQDESQSCLKPSYVLGSALWPLAGEGGCSEEGGQKR